MNKNIKIKKEVERVKISKIIVSVILSIFTIQGLIWCGGYGQQGRNNNANVLILPKQQLDVNETTAILKMREEEKLARDVYKAMYKKWNLQIFYDISNSEQTHMDSVKQLIDKYGLIDPVVDDSEGAFSQPEFRDLYEQLIEKGSKSVIDALKVGAIIEDLDIYDLENELKLTDNDDIKKVFENLKNGSYNHMRAFVGALEAYGDSYTPQYISQEEFETILNSGSGMKYGEKGSSYDKLPGKMKTLNIKEKKSFTYQPTMPISNQYQNKTAKLYALIYSEDLNKYIILTAPNKFQEWFAGKPIVPFETVTLTGDNVTFPIITESVDLSNLTGTFDFYYGFQIDDGFLTYTSEKLIF